MFFRLLTLALALAALTGCADIPSPLQNIALEADASVQVAGNFSYRSTGGTDYHGAHVGHIALTLDQPIARELTCRIGVEHRSLLDTGRDRGEERAFAGFTWRPFAKERP